MDWLRKQMIGRYGYDQLSIALFALSFILMIIARLRGFGFIMFLSYIALAIGIYRIWSRQIVKRRNENYKFLASKRKFRLFFKRKYAHMKGLQTHKYFKCPSCKQKLRAPRGRGKIIVTCTKCKYEFRTKT